VGPVRPGRLATDAVAGVGEIDKQTLARIDARRARVRERVWERIIARHGRIPPARMPGGDLGEQIVLRIDAHFIDAYSRKEHAGSYAAASGCTRWRSSATTPGNAWSNKLRPGTAGADAHIDLLTRAIAQILPRWRTNLLITVDGAGATHKLLPWIASLNREPEGQAPGMRVEYSVGWPVDKHTGRAIAALPAHAWTPMLAVDGLPGIPATLDGESGPLTVGEVADITHLLPHLRSWPAEQQVFVRRVKPLRETTPNRCPASANCNWTCNRPPDGVTKRSPPTAHPPHPARCPAARVRLCAIAAQVSQAPLAARSPEVE
jgi:hypothetical protein